MIGTVVIWATSAHALRTHAFPRWYAWLGIVAGATQLAAFFVFPFLAWWIWIVLTSILLVRAEAPSGRRSHRPFELPPRPRGLQSARPGGQSPPGADQEVAVTTQ